MYFTRKWMSWGWFHSWTKLKPKIQSHLPPLVSMYMEITASVISAASLIHCRWIEFWLPSSHHWKITWNIWTATFLFRNSFPMCLNYPHNMLYTNAIGTTSYQRNSQGEKDSWISYIVSLPDVKDLNMLSLLQELIYVDHISYWGHQTRYISPTSQCMQ